MNIAISKLEYLLKTAIRSLNQYQQEQKEINALFSLDEELQEVQDEVTKAYQAEIQSYREALRVLKVSK